LEKYIQIDITKLVEIKMGGNSKNQGTWVHPIVAIHLANWISADFFIWFINNLQEYIKNK
jgi:hypothetical protein